MKKVVIGSLALASMVVLSSCGLVSDKKDAMEKEAMIKQEMMEKDNEKMIQAEGDAMIKIEGDAMMKKEEVGDAMVKGDVMVKQDDAMMKKEGDYTAYSESLLDEALASGKKVALFFHAPWCPSCKALDTTLKSETIPSDTVILKVDYDTATELKKKYGVTGQHTIVTLDAQKNMVKKDRGAQNISDIALLF